MANPYTGDVDVVVEFSLPAIDRFLALQHQAGVYLHSFAARIDDDDLGVHGVTTVQCSPPAITLPDHDGSRVTVHFQVMARMTPAADGWPATVHGELQVTVPIHQHREAGDDADTITVALSANDLAVTFAPDAGAPLSDDEHDRVTRLIRHFLRTGFEPVNKRVMLSELDGGLTIRHWRFKTLRAGNGAVALLLNLHNAGITDNAAADVGRVFLDGQDFAIAVSRDFLVETLTDLVREALRRAGDFEFHARFAFVEVSDGTIRPDLENIVVELRDANTAPPNGSINVTVAYLGSASGLISATARATASQDFVLALDQEHARITLEASGEPLFILPESLDRLVADLVRGFLTRRVADARARILDRLPPLVEGLPPGLSAIFDGLEVAPPNVTYVQPEITSDGVFIRGSTDEKFWKPAEASFEVQRLAVVEGLDPELGRVVLVRHGLNAFESWIPGGMVHEYRWFEDLEPDDRLATETHRFFTTIEQNVLEDLAVGRDPHQPLQLCLRVSGVQGWPLMQAWAETCATIVPQVPPIRGFDGGMVIDVAHVRGGVGAHLQPWAVDDLQQTIGRPPHKSGGPGVLVLFVGAEVDPVWRAVGEALNARKRKGSGVFVVAVAPSRARLNPLKVDANIGWARTDDPTESWAKTYAPAERPAVYLLSGSSQPVWQQVGEVDRAALTEALDEHLVARRPLLWRQLGLRVRCGQPAPDFVFEYGTGRQMALRTLRKRPAILSFWKSWSAPCLAELDRLHALRDSARRDRPTILAINDGEDPEVARRLFEGKNFALTFVGDRDRRIARSYGVSCWPTTIVVNEHGIVQEIRFGRHAGEPATARARAT